MRFIREASYLFPFLSQAFPLESTSDFASLKSPIIPRQDDMVNIASLYDPSQDLWKMRVSTRCSADQKRKVVNAIAESGYLANALRQWNPGGAYQSSMDKYMGTSSSTTAKDTIQGNINREWELHGIDRSGDINIFIYCDENDFSNGEKRCAKGPTAYTKTHHGFWRREHSVVMCSRFFSDASVPMLSTKLNAVRNDLGKSSSVWSLYGSAGMVWMHETFHWNPTVSVPQCHDTDPDDDSKPVNQRRKVYGPSDVAQFAADKGADKASKIVDSYTMVALSNMLMQTFGLAEPPGADIPGGVNAQDLLAEPVTDDFPDWQGVTSGLTDAQVADDTDASPLAKPWQWFTVKDTANVNPNDYASFPPARLPTCDDSDSKCNHVSSCGSEWMPVDDFTTGSGEFLKGYRSVVYAFCRAVSGRSVAAGWYLWSEYEVGLDQGGDPKDKGKKGYISFEIHNKQKEDSHGVRMADCTGFLNQMTTNNAKGSHCYGDDHKDTKGGTFQVGEDAISYHALGSENKPSAIALAEIGVGQEPAVPDEDDGSGGGSPFDEAPPRLTIRKREAT